MFGNRMRLAALAALVVCATAPAMAQTVGNDSGNNCFPVSCFAAVQGSVFQEVYSSAAFAGTTDIGAASFFVGTGTGDVDTATYDVSWYLTSAPVGGLSTTLSGNQGVLLADWGNITITAPVGSVLTLGGADFAYDPTAGNLLLQVTVESATSFGDYGTFFEADTSGSVLSRAYCTDQQCHADADGLVTEFGPGTVPAPEPTSLAALGTGLAALWSLRRRRA